MFSLPSITPPIPQLFHVSFCLQDFIFKQKKIFFKKRSLVLHYLISPLFKNVSIFFIFEDNLGSVLNSCVLCHMMFSLLNTMFRKTVCSIMLYILKLNFQSWFIRRYDEQSSFIENYD